MGYGSPPTSNAEQRRMPLSSWLFIRERESIRIERPYGFSVIVAGPRSSRAHLLFRSEDALQDYQVATAERLTRAGWFLWEFDQDRRARAPATPYRLHWAVETGHRDRGLVRKGIDTWLWRQVSETASG